MIAVIGEALIDLVANSDGRFAARPGGAGFNTARAIGRLGVTPAFLDRLSGDGFGRLLRSTLDSDGVKLAVPEPADVPTGSTWTAPPRPRWSTRPWRRRSRRA